MLVITELDPLTIFNRRIKRNRGDFDNISHKDLLTRNNELLEFNKYSIDILKNNIKIFKYKNNHNDDIKKNS